jgi:hypothetical protein
MDVAKAAKVIVDAMAEVQDAILALAPLFYDGLSAKEVLELTPDLQEAYPYWMCKNMNDGQRFRFDADADFFKAYTTMVDTFYDVSGKNRQGPALCSAIENIAGHALDVIRGLVTNQQKIEGDGDCVVAGCSRHNINIKSFIGRDGFRSCLCQKCFLNKHNDRALDRLYMDHKWADTYGKILVGTVNSKKLMELEQLLIARTAQVMDSNFVPTKLTDLNELEAGTASDMDPKVVRWAKTLLKTHSVRSSILNNANQPKRKKALDDIVPTKDQKKKKSETAAPPASGTVVVEVAAPVVVEPVVEVAAPVVVEPVVEVAAPVVVEPVVEVAAPVVVEPAVVVVDNEAADYSVFDDVVASQPVVDEAATADDDDDDDAMPSVDSCFLDVNDLTEQIRSDYLEGWSNLGFQGCYDRAALNADIVNRISSKFPAFKNMYDKLC